MTATRTVRKNQRTGAEIEVCTAESQGCDPDGGKWVTICWTHGTICNHETKERAVGWAAYPDEWCEDEGTGRYGDDSDGAATLNSCRGVWEAKGTTSTVYKGHEIEVDKDGHVTVWELDHGSPDGNHWTEPSVAAAKATIISNQQVDRFLKSFGIVL